MGRPGLLAVDDEPVALSAPEGKLGKRYGTLRVTASRETLALLE